MTTARGSAVLGKLNLKFNFMLGNGQTANIAKSPCSISSPGAPWLPGRNPVRRERLLGQPAQYLLIAHLTPLLSVVVDVRDNRTSDSDLWISRRLVEAFSAVLGRGLPLGWVGGVYTGKTSN